MAVFNPSGGEKEIKKKQSPQEYYKLYNNHEMVACLLVLYPHLPVSRPAHYLGVSEALFESSPFLPKEC